MIDRIICKITFIIYIYRKFYNTGSLVTRAEWGAAPPLQPPPNLITLPPSYVIIIHTADDNELACVGCDTCSTRSSCIEIVKSIQADHMRNETMSDIGFNFLIGGDNSVYEGRGWDVAGEHTPDFNNNSISIAFIGNYNVNTPSTKLLETAMKFIDSGIKQSKLAENYKLIGQRQVMNTQSPGDLLYRQIRTWKNWASYGAIEIVKRDEWGADEPSKPPTKLSTLPSPYVIIIHTATKFCTTKSSCIETVARIQADHMQNQRWNDISYNFLVGGEGSIYIGRHWDIEGNHTYGYNNCSIAIAFIGNYMQDDPTKDQIKAVTRLLEYGAAEDKLAKNYELLGQRQLKNTDSPGDKLFEVIKTWEHWSTWSSGGYLDLVTREKWGASPPLQPPGKLITLPPSYVIIAHTAGDKLFCTGCHTCSTRTKCIKELKSIQKDHTKNETRSDIGYNFLVGGDNFIYEGRGWDVAGEHTPDFNNNSICIAFIGNYNVNSPSIKLLETAMKFIDFGIKEGKLAENYKLMGQRQVMNTQSPGEFLYRRIKTWKHWAPYGAIEIVTRAEWGAKEFSKPPEKLDILPPSFVIIIHTATKFCTDKSNCIPTVAKIQADHMQNQSWSDIGYNFLVGGDGSIYIGRDWDIKGNHTCDYNNRSIAVSFIGNYTQDNPTMDQINAVTRLLEYGVEEGKLSKDYGLFGQGQLMNTESPGDKLYQVIKKWKHWSSSGDNLTNWQPPEIVSRQGWDADSPLKPHKPLTILPAPYVIVTHTRSKSCKQSIWCEMEVYNIQQRDIARHHSDIQYNFLVGGDGRVYEGRGWDIEGSHTLDYNKKSLGLAFIGEFFIVDEIPEKQLLAAQRLLELGIRINKLTCDYKLLGQKDGPNGLYYILKDWKHWTSGINQHLIKRSEWGAMIPKSPATKLQLLPPAYVIISHTAGRSCLIKDECLEIVRKIQEMHMGSYGWNDIGYNYLVGGDGNIYEGRGWDVEGAHARGYNAKSLGITFIGNFQIEKPTREQLEVAENLLKLGMRENKLKMDYKLLGHRQVSKTQSPGDVLYNIIKTWDHWSASP